MTNWTYLLNKIIQTQQKNKNKTSNSDFLRLSEQKRLNTMVPPQLEVNVQKLLDKKEKLMYTTC